MKTHNQVAKECRERYIADGRCGYCGEEREQFKRLCDMCQVTQNKHSLRWVHKTRREAIAAYGGVCACCGEANLGFLTLDRVANDGAEHRKITDCGTGMKVYRWIKKHNYPEGLFQALCWNCNCGKRDNGGICPHKELTDRNKWIGESV